MSVECGGGREQEGIINPVFPWEISETLKIYTALYLAPWNSRNFDVTRTVLG